MIPYCFYAAWYDHSFNVRARPEAFLRYFAHPIGYGYFGKGIISVKCTVGDGFNGFGDSAVALVIVCIDKY